MTDRRLQTSLLLALALVAILAGYYWVHKPVLPVQAAALGSALADLAVALFLAALGGGLGRRLLRPARRENPGNQGVGSGEARPNTLISGSFFWRSRRAGQLYWPLTSPGERALVQAALGWGLMALALLGLGLAGLYYAPLAWGLALLLIAWLRREARGWVVDVWLTARSLFFPDHLARLGALFTGLTLALGLLEALAPPLKWDALVYHLTLPKLYAQTHNLRLALDTPFTGMPHLTEMLFTAAVLLRGPGAAQVLGWCFGLVVALGLAAYAAEILGARLAPLAPAILLASPTVALSLAWAYVDLLVMLFALAALIALRRWAADGGSAWLALAGLLSGLAVSCKYTAVVVPAGGLVWILLAARPRGGLAAAGRSALMYSGSVLAVFAPWLLKNWLFTGNPVFPLVFPVAQMDGLRQWFYNRPDLVQGNPLWAAAIFPRALFLGVQGGNDYDATLSPLLVLLPLVLGAGWHGLAPGERQALRLLALFGLAGYLGWVALMYTSAFALQPRLFFGLLPALTLLSAAGLRAARSLDRPQLRLSIIVQAALALSLGLSALENVIDFSRRNPLRLLTGQETQADYRATHLGWYALALERVNALPAGSRVMFLWEARSLECQAPDRCLPDTIIDRWWYLRRTLGPAEAILARWHEEGVTHLLVYEAGVDFVQNDTDQPFKAADWEELESLRGRLRRLGVFGDAYTLYALP